MTEISKEYGAALFMLACEVNQKKEYAGALKDVECLFRENPEYIDLLMSPGIGLTERLDVIEQAFSGKVPEDVVSYLKLLCEKGRMFCFYDSVEEYMTLLKESERVSNVRIISAVELTDDEKAKLKIKLEKVNNCTVSMEYVIDESLIGGIVAEFDGKVLDGSLKTRMRDIKEVMGK